MVTCTDGISRDGFLAMKGDLARNGGAVVREGSHDDDPQIPSEEVVIDGQRKHGAERQMSICDTFSENAEPHLTKNGANERAEHMAN